MKPVVNIFLLFVCASGIIFIQACHNAPSAIPFPEHETEFAQPVSMPYKFSDPKKIKWEIPNPDSIKPATETKLDFDKLPSKPFDIGDFRPLLKPMDEIKFDLKSLPDTTFDLDKLPSQKITFKVSILGQPIRTKATKPRIRDKATRTIFEYGLDQGLTTGGEIPAMFQDSRSFLWIGTAEGLYRFDGENFDLYTVAQGLSNFYRITNLSEDRKGQIWVCSDGGIDVINTGDGILKHLGTSQGLSSNEARCSLEDNLGKVWIATSNGIDIIDPENGILKRLTKDGGLSQNNVFSLLEDNWGNIWIGSPGRIDIANPNSRTLKRLTNAGGLSNRFTKDDKGRIMIRTSGGGLNIVDLQKGILKQLGTAQGVSSDTIFRLKPDHLGHIWIATTAGIDIVDADSGEIKHLSKTALGLSDSFIEDFLADNQGHLWMNDGYAEVYIMNLNGGMFKMLNTQQGLSSNGIGGLLEDDQGKIWMSNGDIVDLKAGTIKHIDSSQGLKLLPTKFLEDENDQIWICGGDPGSGVSVFNRKTGTLKHLTTANGLSSDAVWGFYQDKMDNIWLWSSDHGGTLYDPRSKSFKWLTTAGGLSISEPLNCLEDDQGNIWVPIWDDGVDIIDPKMGTIKHLITGKGQIINTATGLIKDEKGRILINTNIYGIYIIDPAKGTLINFTTKEGLASNGVTSLQEKNGSIYAGTSEGLTIITPPNSGKESTEWRVKTYGKPQLIDHVDFNVNAVLLTKKDQFWWGVGADGIIIMDEPKKDTIIPPAYITGIDIMEQSRLFANRQLFQNNPDTVWSMSRDTFYVNGKMPVDTGYLKTNHITWDSITGPWALPINLTLPYDQNFIRFHFTGTHLGNPEKTKYRYILEGIDKSWSSISDKPFTDDYRNLFPGTYTFKVSSRGFNGLWSKPVELSFTITPPWWKTWWFRTFMGIVFIFILYGIYRWRTATLRKQKRVLEQTVKERTAEVVEEKVEIARQKDVIQKEKDKSDELLLNILPSEVAEELKEKGYTTAKSFEEVTILFSDIKGFTHVAENMTAQGLVKEIDTYFSAFDGIMQQYGLEKIKTIGDAYIAAGGLPEQNTATAQKVVEAAIAMQQTVEKLKQERVLSNKPYFELRIGIHTGPVVAGVVGIKKFQYDIWGDTVNLAARMEQSGVPGKINISQYTYDKVKDQFTCTHRGKIEAKNKGDIDMYFVEMRTSKEI